MFRSLFGILLLASINASTLPVDTVEAPLNAADLLMVERIPKKNIEAVKPIIKAKAALLMDVDTGIVLYEKNMNDPLPMASLTKIMTAMIILENHNLNEIVEVQHTYPSEELGVRIWLYEGEKITVGDLLTAALVRSAGDAVIALAEYHSGNVETFVEEMNVKAAKLHLRHTHFTNPIGLDADEHYSTAYDLALLSKYAMRNRQFRNRVKLSKATIRSTNGRLVHTFDNTNYLLNSYLDILGVKTGTTEGAGASLINLARGDSGQEVIAVVLNSPKRFQENKRLIDWGFRNFSW